MDELVAFDNSLALGKCLQYLNGPLRLLVEFILKDARGERWKESIPRRCVVGAIEDGLANLDTNALLSTILQNRHHFNSAFPTSNYQNTVFDFINQIHMLVRARNMWAHQSTVSNYDMLLIADVVQRIIYDAMTYLTDRCPSLSREPFTQRLLIIQRLYFEALVNQGRSLESAMQVNQQNLQHAAGNLAHIPQPVPMRGYDPRNNMDV